MQKLAILLWFCVIANAIDIKTQNRVSSPARLDATDLKWVALAKEQLRNLKIHDVLETMELGLTHNQQNKELLMLRLQLSLLTGQWSVFEDSLEKLKQMAITKEDTKLLRKMESEKTSIQTIEMFALNGLKQGRFEKAAIDEALKVSKLNTHLVHMRMDGGLRTGKYEYSDMKLDAIFFFYFHPTHSDVISIYAIAQRLVGLADPARQNLEYCIKKSTGPNVQRCRDLANVISSVEASFRTLSSWTDVAIANVDMNKANVHYRTIVDSEVATPEELKMAHLVMCWAFTDRVATDTGKAVEYCTKAIDMWSEMDYSDQRKLFAHKVMAKALFHQEKYHAAKSHLLYLEGTSIMDEDLRRQIEAALNKDYDPYDILGVAKNATLDEIKKKFRKESLENHPDKVGQNASDKEKEEKLKRFHEAREAYDAILKEKDEQAADPLGGEDIDIVLTTESRAGAAGTEAPAEPAITLEMVRARKYISDKTFYMEHEYQRRP